MKKAIRNELNEYLYKVSGWYNDTDENNVIKAIIDRLALHNIYMDGMHCKEIYDLKLCHKSQEWPLIDENEKPIDSYFVLSRYWGSNNGRVEIQAYVS